MWRDVEERARKCLASPQRPPTLADTLPSCKVLQERRCLGLLSASFFVPFLHLHPVAPFAHTPHPPCLRPACRDIVPLGKVRSNWNFSLEDKRVLNFVNVVSDEDNIRQDLSIDVYGRKKKEDIAAGEGWVPRAVRPHQVRMQ